MHPALPQQWCGCELRQLLECLVGERLSYVLLLGLCETVVGCPVVLQLGWKEQLAPVLELRGHQCESLRLEFGLWPWHTGV